MRTVRAEPGFTSTRFPGRSAAHPDQAGYGRADQAVRGAGITLQGRVLDDLRRQVGPGAAGHDLVIISVQVRYLPQDPTQIEGNLEPDDGTVRATPQDAAPRLGWELDHLDTLHATGRLAEAEFATAKRLPFGGCL
ncbi:MULTISPECIES: hypothetical protein [unclassified Frankia]|uniref:hypothetical protein n=1 Tax=unclassified Frankia TaxID=2632575 RepID=UPI002AD3C996|nr:MULTISPECIES: hypothetical protein [unclassified Frankia]